MTKIVFLISLLCIISFYGADAKCAWIHAAGIGGNSTNYGLVDSKEDCEDLVAEECPDCNGLNVAEVFPG